MHNFQHVDLVALNDSAGLGMSRTTRSLQRRGHHARILGIVISGCCWFVTPAWAGDASLEASLNPATPEQGIPASFVFAGSTPANFGGDALEAEYRPTGGIGCQGSFQNDYESAGGASVVLAATTNFGDGPSYGEVPWDEPSFFGNPPAEGPGGFNHGYTLALPATGTYLLCAYLEHSEPEGHFPPNVVDATASLTFSVSPPKVESFSVGLPSPAQPERPFTINYTTQTDQKLRLASVVVPAGGVPCGENVYRFIEEVNPSADNDPGYYNLFSEGGEVFGGPVTTSATYMTKTAGPYVICSWIEGPRPGEVDATLTTPIYVGTPPPPAPPPKPAVSVSSACLRDREHVAHDQLVIRHYEHKLKEHHLSRHQVRSSRKILTRSRATLKASEALRRKQCPHGR